ncbi:uncharacterized protein LOC141718993 [Apium graveolens]|uniref:uncharacterized protein LOC141718993 n=1 Tax=Apium graveolens TaxID=4045 RepID=UPI003D7A6F29
MECTFPDQQLPAPSGTTPENTNPNTTTNSWKLYVDGSSTTERSGAELILISPEGFTIQQEITFAFKATNNQAEYEALISGLRLAKSLRVRRIVIHNDSQIVVRQMSSEYIAKDEKLARYQTLVRGLLKSIPNTTILQINKEENRQADELSKLVQNSSDLSSSVYFEELQTPSTEKTEILCIDNPDNWMTPFIAYLRDITLPKDQNKAKYLKHKDSRFFLENDQLYRRTFSVPTLKCVDTEEADYCLWEVHEGICRYHLAAKALAYKIIIQGYYWPTIHSDSVAYVKKCHQCQKFRNVPKQNPSLPASVLSPISFAVWGIDIIGPFPRVKGDFRYVFMAIDYMTKWAEVKAMRIINQQDCIKFMNSIIMRFGIPVVLVLDNGP